MCVLRLISVLTVTAGWIPVARGELWLTAELVPTIGITGVETYRITATSDLGSIVAFDFTEVGSYGVFGPLSQVNPLDQPTIFTNLNSQFGATAPALDTQFLASSDDVLSIHTSESAGTFHGAFSFLGDKQQTIGNSVTFLQIATPSAADVNLKGAFAIRRPNDEIVEAYIDLRLADIPLGPAPSVAVLPVPTPPLDLPEPPPAPVIPPPDLPSPIPPTAPPPVAPEQHESSPEPPLPVSTAKRPGGLANAIREALGTVEIGAIETRLAIYVPLGDPWLNWSTIDMPHFGEVTNLDPSTYIGLPNLHFTTAEGNSLAADVATNLEIVQVQQLHHSVANRVADNLMLNFANPPQMFAGLDHTAAVPEPSTLGLCLAAMGLASCAAHRQSR